MLLFQTSWMVQYACLGKKTKNQNNIIRPNHVCVLFATGILGYKFPLSVCPSPTHHLLPQPPLILFHLYGCLPLKFYLRSRFFFPLAPTPTLQGQNSLDLFFYLHQMEHGDVLVVNSS